jgi:PKD repeat protein
MVSHEWDVDYDGTDFNVDLSGSLVDHTYLEDGTYTIAFLVTDDDGTTDLWTTTLDIGDVGPKADIQVESRFFAEGALVILSAGSSISFPDELVAYHWDWEGDGEIDDTTLDVNGKHVFNTPGKYEVKLTVEDDDGSTDTTSVHLTITDVVPIAKLEANPVDEGSLALLNASGSEEPGSDLVAFRWDLTGDGSWDVEETCSTLEWVWYEPGMYSITVQVEDEDGSTAKKSMTLVVQDIAPAVDAGGPYEVDEGIPLDLIGSGTHEPGKDYVVFKWDMDGDNKWDVESRHTDAGGILTDAQWTYDLAGTYTVHLYVEVIDGSFSEGSTDVVVSDMNPVFEIILPSDVQENVPANFTLDPLYDPGTEEFVVTWRFGDGTTARGVTVDHVFNEQGDYMGSVTVKDNDDNAYTVAWPSALSVANSAPVVELSIVVLTAIEDSEFVMTVVGKDTLNDTVSYSIDGPGGTIDPATGEFKWTPLNDHVGKNEFTFIATDEDGGEGTLTVDIDVEDVDNDFLGMSTATGLGLIALMILVLVVAALVVARQRGMIGGGKAEDEIIQAEDADLGEQIEVDLLERATEPEPEVAEAPPVVPATAPPPDEVPRKKKRPPGAPPRRRKKRPPGAPPRKKRPPGAPPRKKRPPGAPPRKKRPPGAPPRKKRPPGAPPRKKRPPGAPRRRKKRPPGAPPRKKKKRPPPTT